MAAVAEKRVEQAVPATFQPSRRLQLADLDRHGRWIMERLLKVYPGKTDREMITWLRGIIYSNDFLFLYREHGVALAYVTRPHPLTPPHLQEIFVLAQAGHEAEAAAFYDDMVQWAKHQGITSMVVEELTDVPHELIREKLGRVFAKQVQFARL